MQKRIRAVSDRLWPEFVGQALPWAVAMIIGVGSVVWAVVQGWLESSYAPLTPLLLLGVVVLTFHTTNVIGTYRRGRRVNHQDTIMKWLFDYGHTIQKVPKDNTLWQIRVTASGENITPVTVAVLKKDPDFAVIGVVGQLNPQEQAELSRYTANDNDTLIHDLRIEMSRFGMEFSGLSHPLKNVYLTYKIPLDDNLTKLSFMQAFLKARHAVFANLKVDHFGGLR